ncbi:MAG: ligase-associated DNA damage response DEXH box helicase [Parachlamydiaceae bacterium]|nr:ligase-associated DNA damage response DEXH box helicase [Parachlamydiaceae bacterium]
MDKRLKPIHQWFQSKNWTPWPFQEEAWQSALDGESGLISVPTGSGKTYAAFLGPLAAIASQPISGLKILYITPLRALTRDIEQAVKLPIEDLEWNITVESRMGDTSYAVKKRQKKIIPNILLTTPESLSILQADPEHYAFFKDLDYVIVDEWHELLASKRGVLLELSLSHLRSFLPSLKIWGLSATLGNLQQAAHVLLGSTLLPRIIHAKLNRPIIIDTVLPATTKELPWSGYLGLTMLPYVLKLLQEHTTTMIFTNTRSQAEIWFRNLVEKCPHFKGKIALHHSSIDKKMRHQIENALKNGEISVIVCTSSLDLGVDFPSVDRVIQIGSCKSLIRLVQRAGRASHRPMTPCHISVVPSHALELAEILAVKKGLEESNVESRIPFRMCYDVLFQHLITLAIGGGFSKAQTLKTIKTTHAYADLSLDTFDDILTHLQHGGKSLSAYPDYHKLTVDEEGIYRVTDRAITMRHRMQIGTITSDATITIKLMNGKKIGSIEENFLAQLKPNEAFSFAGKVYKVVQMADLSAYVRINKEKTKIVIPVWLGSKLPLSPSLAFYVRMIFHRFAHTHTQTDKEALSFEDALDKEAIFLEDICHIQRRISAVPTSTQLLVEVTKRKEGYHYYFYPFEGKLIHETLAALISYRMSKFQKATLQLAVSDYGFEILSSKYFPIDVLFIKSLLSMEHLLDDLQQCINIQELAKAKFREIARIAGLVFSGFPGRSKSNRQLQVSSAILFDVFMKYEHSHLLLMQAFQEVFSEQIQSDRFQQILQRLSEQEIIIKETQQLTPFSLPIYVTAMFNQISSEDLIDRLKQITSSWETS